MKSTKIEKTDAIRIENAKKELGINRWLALVLYAIVSCATGLLHGGFSEWQSIIYKTGAFEYLCEDKWEDNFKVSNTIYYKSCRLRDATINNLSTVSFFVQFLLSPLNGYILDKFGSKLCFLFGQAIIILAFLLLIIFQRYSIIWYFFFVLLGLSTDPAFISLLHISSYFPGRESLVFGILGSARSTSFGIPLILSTIYFYGPPLDKDQFYILCIFYLCTLVAFACMVGIFVIPRKSIIQKVQSKEINSQLDNENHITSINSEEQNSKSLEKETPEKSFKTKYMNLAKDLWRHPQKWEYIIIVFICGMNVLRFNYYLKTFGAFFKFREYNITTVFSIATTLSFIPSPFFGFLVDKFGPLFVLSLNNLFLLLSFLVLFIKHIVFRYISIVFFFLFVSFCFSAYHCYINARYPKEHFGKLSGFMFFVGAIFLSFNFYLTYLTDIVFYDKGEEKFYPVVAFLSVAGAFVLILCLYMRKYQKIKVSP